MIMANGSSSYKCQFDDDDDVLDVTANEDEPMDFESLVAETTGGDCWEFADDDDLGLFSTANEDEPVDFESLFNEIGEKTRGDYSKNGLADPLSSAACCSEPVSYGANEHSETQNRSLASPFLHDSEALSSRPFYNSGGSFVTERQSYNSGFQHFTGNVADWQTPVPAHVTPCLSNHGVNQDFLSSSNFSTIGTTYERGNNNDAFGFTNGNHQLIDRTGIDDRTFESLIRDSYQTLEVPENAEAPMMNLGGYCDFLDDPNHEFYNTCINESFYFGSTRQIHHSSNNNGGMLYNVKSESEEHLMQNLSKNSAMNYEIVTERPGGVATAVDCKSDSGPYVSETCSPSGESSISKPAKESTRGYHGRLHMLNKKQVVPVKNEKHGALVITPGTACKKQSPAGALPKNICKKVKFETNDKQSGHQVPSQEFPHQKSWTSLPDDGLAVPLLRHQRSALSWMSKKETKSTHCCGGILADDQGLGKTISAIALILKERSPPSSSSVSAIEEKDKETETLCLDEQGEEIATNMQTNCSVSAGTLVVCPTSVLRQWNEELQNKVISEANLSVLVYYGVNRTKDPFELAKYDVVLTTYAIVSMEVPKQPLDDDEDETKIKLSPSKKRKYPPTSDETPKKEPSEPIDRPLAKLRWFRVILDEAQSIKNYKTQVARACWGLKAKRRWCLSGTPIQNSIDDLYSYFRFLRYGPFAVFKTFCSQIKAPIQKNPVAGYKRLQVILKIIMLRRTKGTLFKGEPIISLPPKTIILKKVDFTAEERGFYRSLEAESRAQFAEYAAAGTVKQNYVNILLMLLRLRQACDHPLLVKECNSTTDWRSSIEKAKELPQEKINRLLNCLEASLAICSICNDPPEDAVVTTCEHVFCNQCILEHLSNDDSQCPSSECKKLLSRSSVFCKSTLNISISDDIPNSDLVESDVNSIKIEAAKAFDSSKIKAALEVLQSISKPQDATVNDDNNNNIKGNSVLREKAILFSQWTRMLDLVEVCLKDSSIGYRRLDGTMSVVARDKAVKDFNTLPEVTVIIMSLKAASLGLNMVAACHVILLDLWWNPTMEDQAIDRAHRIGQTRPVTVFRFTVKDTIEDRILALQKKKREMVASAFGDDKNGGSQTRLTLADIKYLFQA